MDRYEGDTDASALRNRGIALGAAATLQSNLAELRAIKNVEIAWLDRYAILVLPMIAGMYATVGAGYLSRLLLVGTTAGYLALTMWFQDMLRKERRSYYRVLRSAVRLQNYLGLIAIGLVPQSFADPFPEGLGPNPTRDGTQPFSSFLRRQVLTMLGFVFISVGVLLHDVKLWPCLGFILLDALWVVWMFREDRRIIWNDCLAERHLLGASPEWFPAFAEEGRVGSKPVAAVSARSRTQANEESCSTEGRLRDAS